MFRAESGRQSMGFIGTVGVRDRSAIRQGRNARIRAGLGHQRRLLWKNSTAVRQLQAVSLPSLGGADARQHLRLGDERVNGRRSLYVTRDVSAGAELINVDETGWERADAVRERWALRDEAWDDPAALALCYLAAQVAEANSKMSPQLREVLRDDSVRERLPLLWGEAVMEAFRGTEVHRRWRERRQRAQRQWKSMGDALRQRLGLARSVSFEDYLVALAVATDRMISAADDSGAVPAYLAPGLDEVQCTAPSDASAEVRRRQVGLLRNRQVLTLVALRALRTGEEVRVGWTASDVIECFLQHGRVDDSESGVETATADEESPWAPALTFELSTMDRFFDDKVDILEAVTTGGSPAGAPRYTFAISEADVRAYRASQSGPLGDLMQLLRLVCLAGADAFLLESVFRGSVWDHMALPVSDSNERAAYDYIMAACEERLAEMEAAEDGAGDVGDAATPRQRHLAERFRHAERAVFRAIIDCFQEQKALMGTFEYYQERRLRDLDLLRPVDPSEVVDTD